MYPDRVKCIFTTFVTRATVHYKIREGWRLKSEAQREKVNKIPINKLIRSKLQAAGPYIAYSYLFTALWFPNFIATVQESLVFQLKLDHFDSPSCVQWTGRIPDSKVA